MSHSRTVFVAMLATGVALSLRNGWVPAVQTLAATPVLVTLSPAVTPPQAQPGVTTVNLLGNNFPAGTIRPADIEIRFDPVAVGPPGTTSATTLVTLTGTSRRITFTVPSSLSVAEPAPYQVSVSGTTSAGVAFASTNKVGLQVLPGARLASMVPSHGQPGQAFSVALTGQYTTFLQGSTRASFGAGISVGGAADGAFGPVTVTSPTSALAGIRIAASANPGERAVEVRTGVQQAAQAPGFVVSPGGAQLLSVAPDRGRQGQSNLSVLITGIDTHFSHSSSAVSFGPGITVTAIMVTDATHLTANIAIGPAAAVGQRNVSVTTGSEIAAGNGRFAVIGAPRLVSVLQNQGKQEQTLTVTLTGEFTSFQPGLTTASFGQGISVGGAPDGEFGPVTVTSPTTASAQLRIARRAEWQQVTMSGDGPGIRGAHSTVYIPQWNQALIFGGGGIGTTGSNNLWRVNSTGAMSGRWDRVTTAGTLPLPRGAHSAVYDSATDRMIVFGGGGLRDGAWGPALGDLYVLENASAQNGQPTWRTLYPAGEVPSGRLGHVAFFDPGSNRMIVYGGKDDNNTYFDEVWCLENANGLGGDPRWRKLQISGLTPGPTAWTPTAAYDALGNRLLLQMMSRENPGVSDLWALSSANGLGGTPTWSKNTVLGAIPIPLGSSEAYFDPVSATFGTVFGGNFRPESLLGRLRGNTVSWERLGPLPVQPAARQVYGKGQIYDSQRDRLLVMGGSSVQGSGGIHWHSDVWLLDAPARSAVLGSRKVSVRTGGEQVALENGFEVHSAQPSPAFRLSPGVAYATTSVTVEISADNVDFENNPPLASFGPGASVGGAAYGAYGPLTVLQPRLALAHVHFVADAPVGYRDVSVRVGGGDNQIKDGFFLRQASDRLLVSPIWGSPGQRLQIQIDDPAGQYGAFSPRVYFGNGIDVETVQVVNAQRLLAMIHIDPAAAIGNRPVTVVRTAGLVPDYPFGLAMVSEGGFAVVTSAPPNPPPPPNATAITQVSPNVGQLGQQNLSVAISGQNTHFAQGVSAVSFGAGIGVHSVSVSSPTRLTAIISIAGDASLGARTVQVTTSEERVSQAGGFSVQQPTVPVLTGVSPTSGKQGQASPITIVGTNTHFAQGLSQLDLGPGIAVSNVSVANATSLTAQIAIADDAPTTSRTIKVTTGAEVAPLANGFTVLAGEPILTSVVPDSGQRGQSLAVAVTGKFTQFAQGALQVSFGAGVTVTSIVVTSPTQLIANIAIDAAASVGPREVCAGTGINSACLEGKFRVAGTPRLVSVLQNNGKQEQTLTVTLTGEFTAFQSGVTTASFGQGISVGGAPEGEFGPVTVTSPTTASAQLGINRRAEWQQLTMSGTGPGIIGAHSTVYIPKANQALLFGGTNVHYGASNVLWRVNVTGPRTATWELVSTAGTVPPARVAHSAVYDDSTDRMILFGGGRGSNGWGPDLGDVHVLEKASGQSGQPTWRPLYPSGGGPSARLSHVAFFDPGSNRMIVFGGKNDSNTYFDEVWVLANANGTTGTSQWNRLEISGPTPGPTAWNPTTAYDPVGNRLLVYAMSRVNPGASDLWVLSHANGLGGTPVWSKSTVDGLSPLPLGGSEAFFDPQTNTLGTVFGGNFRPESLLGRVSADSVTWQRLGPFPVQPSGRTVWSKGQVYDSAGDRVLIAGGTSVNELGFTLYSHGDVWMLDAPARSAVIGQRTVRVQTGNEHVALQNGFEVHSAQPAPAFLLSPGVAYAGTSVTVEISADNVDFEKDPPSANFGPGASVGGGAYGGYGPLTVLQPRLALAHIHFAPSVTVGYRDVNLRVGSISSASKDGFFVRLDERFLVSPTWGSPGQRLQVQIDDPLGQYGGFTPRVYFGDGIDVESVQVVNTKTLVSTIRIDPAASIGNRPVTVVRTPGLVPDFPFGQARTSEGGFAVVTSAPPNPPPPPDATAITQVSPNVGQPDQQNLSVAISGQNTHFTQGVSAVSFGAGIVVGSVTVSSPTRLTATISIAGDAPLGPRTVQVTTGEERVSQAGGFSVQQPTVPVLTQVSPASGKQGQGGGVTIVGANTHFVQGQSQLDLGPGISVSNVVVTCATCLTAQIAIAEDAPVTSRTVKVTTGAEVAPLANGFTVQPGDPILTSVVPASGRQGQNVAVAITGKFTHFAQGTTQVAFGAGISVASIVVNSPTSLTANITIAADALLTTRPVTVTSGSETISTPGPVFTVQPPPLTITFAPVSIRQAASASITITGQGTHFAQGLTQVSFGPEITVGSVVVANATRLTAQITAAENAATGPRPVTVTTGDETATAANAFSVELGTVILSLNPGGAYQGQTVPVTITGQLTNFVQGVSRARFGAGISVGGAPEGEFGPITVAGPTTASALVAVNLSAAVAPRTVTVQSGSESAAFTLGFSVLPAPLITTITPNSAQAGQQDVPITITGQNTHFASASQIDLGPDIEVARIVALDSTHLSARLTLLPTATAGARTVIVTTGDEEARGRDLFNVTPDASLTSLSVTTGARGQRGIAVAIAGQNTHFSSASVVDLGAGIAVSKVVVTDAAHLTAELAVAEDAPLGSRTLVVTTGAEVARRQNAFTVTTGTNQKPEITIAPSWSVTLPSRLTLTYTVTDDRLPSGGRLTVIWERVSGPGAYGFEGQTHTDNGGTVFPGSISAGFDTAGTHVLRITATDTEFTVSQDVTVTVNAQPPKPTVVISGPVDGTEITAPVEVFGTASSPALASWTLEYKRPEESGFKPFASGTTSVVNGVLAKFDPTALLNGLVVIRLTARDLAGQTAESPARTLLITRNLKIGNFTVSFNDLTVPMPGMPIQIVRTYDSRNLTPGDFGYGWTLDLKTVRLSENIVPGTQWRGVQSGTPLSRSYCVEPVSSHIIAVTMQDGNVYRFQPVLSLTPGGPAQTKVCQQFVPFSEVTVGFAPFPGTNASLSAVGNATVQLSGGFQGDLELLDGVSTFDPDRYVLTLSDGRALRINQAAGLESMRDLNGNTLTIDANGIHHSSGKAVLFSRQGAAQNITKITDPAGNSINYSINLVTGDLDAVTDRDNQTTTFTYDAHRLQTIRDPRGIQPIRNDYDSSGRLIEYTDAFGKKIKYDHRTDTRQEVVTDRLGNVTVNEYDLDGNVVHVTDAAGGITKRKYDARGNMTEETNPLGKIWKYEYDANDNRTKETDPTGAVTQYTYDARNQVLTIRDPLGQTTTNAYDPANGNLLMTRDARGGETIHTYNAQGLLSTTRDALGNTTSYAYDSAGNLTKVNEPTGGAVITYTYDANGNRKSETKRRTTTAGAETLTTSFEYNKSGQLVKTTHPDGSTTETQYNSIGKQSVTIDALTRRTLYDYDELGRLIKTTFPDGYTELSKYDAEGRRTESTDRGGRTTIYRYDAMGRLLNTQTPDGAISKTQYNLAGQVTATTDARDNTTRYEYDDAGRRTRILNALNQPTRLTYDDAGNQKTVTDAAIHTTQFDYDVLNRRVRTTYVDGTSDTVTYDALGRTTAKTDQAGLVTQYRYDALGRLTEVIDALSQSTKYTYDELGNRLTQTDANNHTTRFEYDRVGRRTRRTLPLGMAEEMTYDAAGNLKTKKDFNGKTTTYNYDTANRLTARIPDPSFGEPAVTFTYTASGQRLSMADASGTTSYMYDQRDRLSTKSTPQGTLTYAYDLVGNLTSIRSSNAGGTSVDYTYDELNRLLAAKDNRLASGTTSYTYDAVGNLETYTYPNGAKTTHTYSNLNRLTDLTITAASVPLARYTYELGPAGNRKQVSELGGRTVKYDYDKLYRLTSETIAGSTTAAANGIIGYLYDPVGNRKQRTSTVAAVPPASYSHDANDRLTTDGYDANGNTVASGGASYTYDSENRLKSKNGSEVTLIYDGDGNRVSKTARGLATRYLVDDRSLTGYAQVLEEIGGGTVALVYTYGLNRISQSQASGTSFYGYDGHGSVRLLTDAAGAVTDRYTYDSFGMRIDSSGNSRNTYLYAGEELTETGFINLRSRWLSPGTGRFITLDKHPGDDFVPMSRNGYLYADANPVNRIDPDGSFALSVDAIASSYLRPFLTYAYGIRTTLFANACRNSRILSTPIAGIPGTPFCPFLESRSTDFEIRVGLDASITFGRWVEVGIAQQIVDIRSAEHMASFMFVGAALSTGFDINLPGYVPSAIFSSNLDWQPFRTSKPMLLKDFEGVGGIGSGTSGVLGGGPVWASLIQFGPLSQPKARIAAIDRSPEPFGGVGFSVASVTGAIGTWFRLGQWPR